MDGGPAILPILLKAAAFLLVACNLPGIDAADPVPSDWRTGIATFYGQFVILVTRMFGWLHLALAISPQQSLYVSKWRDGCGYSILMLYGCMQVELQTIWCVSLACKSCAWRCNPEGPPQLLAACSRSWEFMGIESYILPLPSRMWHTAAEGRRFLCQTHFIASEYL